MKTLQRQLQVQPHHKSPYRTQQNNNYEQVVRRTNRSHLSIQQAVTKRMLNFHHRRKYQPAEFKLSVTQPYPRKSEPVENIARAETRMGEAKRHTCCGSDYTQPNQEQKPHIERQTMRQLRRQRAKESTALYKTVYPEEFQKTFFAWKVKESTSKTQEKTEENQLPSQKFKKCHRFNATTYSFNPSTQEGSFLSLIEKFRFQNLKTTARTENCVYSDERSGEAGKQQPITHKTHNQRSPCRNTLAYHFPQKQAQRKLIPLLQTSKNKSGKVTRKLSSLTPWQLPAEAQMCCTPELLQHI